MTGAAVNLDLQAAAPQSAADPAEVAISVENVSKVYRGFSNTADRLNLFLARRLRKVAPNSSFVKRAEHAAALAAEFVAVEDVSLQIRAGESWGVIGVNGSGKSTLLKMIAGTLPPTSGRIEVRGRLAILDYSSGMNPEFTGYENIFIRGAMLGMTREQIKERLDSIVEFAEIGSFIEKPVKTYSSGMMARLGFAIMAHADADILITDEALAVGDAFFVQKCMRWIRDYLDHGTFVMVSHSISDIMALCDKAIWLENGRVKAIGAAKDVGHDYMSSANVRRTKRFKLSGDGAVLADGGAEERAVEEARRAGAQQLEADRAAQQRAHEAQAAAAGADGAAETTSAPEAAEQEPGAPEALSGAAAHLQPASREIGQPALAERMEAAPPRVVKDPRREFSSKNAWVSAVEAPVFDPTTSSKGIGGARIEDVYFEDVDGAQFSHVIGGELVRLVVVARAETRIEMPLLGFQVLDRLGQSLFAENTVFATDGEMLPAEAGSVVRAMFEFQMPLLPRGEYVVRVAVAEGEADGQATILTANDSGMILRCTTSGPRHGLVGVPMQRIKIEVGG